MVIERKNLLIALAIVLFVFISVPVVIFNSAIKKYLGFLNIWSQKPITSIKPRMGQIPPTRPYAFRADLKEPELKVISFSLKTKKPAEIFIAGDFNKWKKNDIKLSRKENGVNETMIALAPGSYKYVFYVDGKKVLDPHNPLVTEFENEKVSLIEIK